jgi:hypothetical protein
MKFKHDMGKVYTPGMPMRLFVLLMALLVAGMHAFILRNIGGGNTDFPMFLFGFILLFDAFFLWFGIIFMTQTRVIVSEDGIELQRGGARAFTPWENISHFGVKGGGKNQRRGIYLYNKIKPEVNGLAEKLFYGWETDFLPIGQVINLPTRWGFLRNPINYDKLANTEFGQDVDYYAPHLLDERQEKYKYDSDRLTSRSSDAAYVVGADERTLRKQKR